MIKPSRVQQVLAHKGDAIDEIEMKIESPPAESAVESGANRIDRIRMAAYAASERRGFQPGHEDDDWLQAEREVDAQVPLDQDPGTDA